MLDIDRLLAEPADSTTWKHLLDKNKEQLSDEFADALKAKADHFVRADLQKSLQSAEILLYLAELTGNSEHRALGLLASANAHMVGLGQHQQAIDFYNQAAAIYESQGLQVQQAQSQIGKLWSLASLGRYDEAFETGHWVMKLLEDREEWLLLARTTVNLGILSGRLGRDEIALNYFDQAANLYREHLDKEHQAARARVEYNRAIVLRNLGRFGEAIEASQTALDWLMGMDQPADVARAKQTLALTYFVLGRYNEALILLQEVLTAFKEDARHRDAALTQMFISDCLLKIGRYADVLERMSQVRQSFAALGTVLEEAQATVNEAIALARLGRHKEAKARLAAAHHHFEIEDNHPWIAISDLELAIILYHEERFAESLDIAGRCVQQFSDYAMPERAAASRLVMARSALALEQFDTATYEAQAALHASQAMGTPFLIYQGHYLLGQLARLEGNTELAMHELEQAIDEIERLRGQLMVELWADFLADKEAAYMEAIELCLDEGQFDKALEYAERAKSRALLELISSRLDLSLKALSKEDEPLVEELLRLRRKRDQLYRRWQSDEDTRSQRWDLAATDQPLIQQDVWAIEKQIEEQWHTLLIRNTNYAHDASTWQVYAEPPHPHLPPDTLICEYFLVKEQLVAFLVSQDETKVHQFSVDVTHVQRLMHLFWLNLHTVPQNMPVAQEALKANALYLLSQLHSCLVAPLKDDLASYKKLIIIPHNFLYYLPFHALYDGEAYLLEQLEVSYLPSSSLLSFYQKAKAGTEGMLSVGYSGNDRLPHAVDEAVNVAKIMSGEHILEEAATLEMVQKGIPACRTIHIATHGSFRADNPLFSGLALVDGWLTTFDIFNMHIPASLVTLSGCQTGQSTVAGGDELLGLMRAFLYAGTASLLVSLWSVEDQATAELMTALYTHLADGMHKGAAVQQTQREAAATGTHPYYWASFFLVGDTGHL